MTVAARPSVGSLPADVTSFVGRRTELVEIRQALAQSRLVTLVGVGGVGKTRLALKGAADVRRAFPDGAWFVDLAPLQDDDLLVSTVATALRLQSRSRGWGPPALARHLADRDLLIVLDNCEQVRHACAVLADSLLRMCPSLRVLATSRQALEIGGERLVPVRPLPLPGGGEVPSAHDLQRYDAVVLFTERAQAVAPAFEVGENNRHAVAALCQRLDGIPLALELAAARLRVLAPQQILDRLDAHAGVLASGSTVGPERHRSLHALIGWSYELCSWEERMLWSRLSVFPGTFDLDAVEGVCAGDDLPQQDVLDLISGLVDKSIVLAEPGLDPVRDPVRYRMPETIRTYGRDQLRATDQVLALRRRHRDHFARTDLSRQGWFGPHQRELLGRMLVERDNYRAALNFCTEAPDEGTSSAVHMVLALAADGMVHGFLSESRHWMRQVLELVDEPTYQRAVLLWVDGWSALNQGDVEGAQARLKESRDVATGVGDPGTAAVATTYLGMCAMMRGDMPEARRLYEEAYAHVSPEEQPLGFALASGRLGFAAFVGGDAERGLALCEESLAQSVQHGDLWHRAETLTDLATIEWLRGDPERATELAAEGLRIRADFDNAVGIAHYLEVLAWIASGQGQHARAARLLGAADALWHTGNAALFPYLSEYRDKAEQEVRRGLGQRAFDVEYRSGLQRSLAENIAFALGDLESLAGLDTGAVEKLTRREGEIVDLVADGLSNKEIATKLVISPRTVEGHVEHILAKLGFTSRSQVAVWAVERRDGTGPAPGS